MSNRSTDRDTIAAIATASGHGGVGIIRISGKNAYQLGINICEHNKLEPRYAHYGKFINNDQIIDEGIALYFPGPHSFTGEDVIELQAHGGPIVLDQLLKQLIKQGARLAKPGEFSERAFLNDKIDLTQAEAIADLINAHSEQAMRNAVNSLQGVFSTKVHELVDQITHLRMYVEAAIDFPEEEIDFLKDQKINSSLKAIQKTLDTTLKQAKQGVLIQEGMTVVIAGKPNAGKSSLLNAMAGRESAIVTDIEGTTRDILRENIHLDGMPLHIIDTAGLRNTNDIVEQIGVEKAWKEIEKADRILLLIDATTTTDINNSIEQFISENNEKCIEKSRISVIYNKIDQTQENAKEAISDNIPVIYLSAKTGNGMDLLIKHLQKIMGYSNTQEGGFTARRRHIDALESAQQNLKQAENQLQQGAGELLAEDLKTCQINLGEITGQISPDDLLGKIFSSFCIGK